MCGFVCVRVRTRGLVGSVGGGGMVGMSEYGLRRSLGAWVRAKREGGRSLQSEEDGTSWLRTWGLSSMKKRERNRVGGGALLMRPHVSLVSTFLKR